jgi:hypothetical protein
LSCVLLLVLVSQRTDHGGSTLMRNCNIESERCQKEEECLGNSSQSVGFNWAYLIDTGMGTVGDSLTAYHSEPGKLLHEEEIDGA